MRKLFSLITQRRVECSHQKQMYFFKIFQDPRLRRDAKRKQNQAINKRPPSVSQKTSDPAESSNNTETTEKPPHNLDEILKEADPTLKFDKSPIPKIYEQLYNGIFLKRNKKRYWVDKTTKANCFMLYAKELSITWGEDDRYWKWITIKEEDSDVKVAEVESVCWLEVSGRFGVASLTPGTTYEVVFVVKIKEDAEGWDSVNLRLILPDKTRKQGEAKLKGKEKDKWIELRVGEFMQKSDKSGKNEEIEMFMYETAKLNSKRGLVIKGIEIRPKKM